MFVFGDFNVRHEDWLTYSAGTDRPGELCYIFPISNDLPQIVDFPTRISNCDFHSHALLDFFLLMLVIVAKGFSKLPNLHMLLKQKESITSQKLGSRDF